MAPEASPIAAIEGTPKGAVATIITARAVLTEPRMKSDHWKITKGASCQRVIMCFIQLALFNRLSKSLEKLPGKAVKARLTHGSK